MAVLHDFQCDRCGDIVEDMPATLEGTKCICRKGVLEIYYSPRGQRNAAALDTKEMTVVYENPATGKVIYPGRNDRPVPDYYARQGFVRREMRSLRAVDRFCSERGLVNERAHYDGSGRGYDDRRE